MKLFLLVICLSCCTTSRLMADAAIVRSARGWEMTNGEVRLALVRSPQGVQLESLTRKDGAEWVVPGNALCPLLLESNEKYTYFDDNMTNTTKGGKQLTLRFKSDFGGLLSLKLLVYPKGAVIEFSAELENQGQRTLPSLSRIDPLRLSLKVPVGGLKPYSSITGKHGFHFAGDLSSVREFSDWLVLGNDASGESALIGGELGGGILGWRGTIETSADQVLLHTGNILPGRDAKQLLYEVAPGQKVETPISFIALAKGDADDAGNQAFRYLKHYVLLEPVANAPLVAYCVWLTEANSEERLLEELQFARRVGFDAFYHDASWFEDSSIVPGMNDWSKGLGAYRESKEKFPQGLKKLSDAVRAAGMKFGIWVDPGNVDAARVDSGEIPNEWLAMIDGKPLGSEHPSLATMKQLCLGDPKVVEWLKKQLASIIEQWNLEWIKWDPSGTVSHSCNRTDHGHGQNNGAYAAYRGRLEILRHLMDRFPQLSGFECDPSLHYTRTNPGPRDLLPGGYTNEFITGPMVSPLVWGSLATAGMGDASAAQSLTGRWYSASALDYQLRRHFTHGVSFGNINGMASQLLSQAPSGYIEAFKRNLLYFKMYRHLLFEDVYHLRLQVTLNWSSMQYVKEHSSESVVFVFRDGSDTAQNTVYMRGLDQTAKYRVTSLNDRPGRDRVIDGETLTKGGIAVNLPDPWLAKGDGSAGKEFEDQLRYGSDILLLKRLP
jgi:hypothetical protein